MSDQTPLTLSDEDRKLMEDWAADAVAADDLPKVLGEFRYLGQGLTADQFTEYVRTYNFGSIPPDFVVLHHSAVPSTSAARYPSGWTWDTDEGG